MRQTIAGRCLIAVAVCAILSLTGSFSAAQGPDSGKRVALLVGVNKYDKRNFHDLEYAERDVEELAKVLESAAYDVHLLTGTAQDHKRATLGTEDWNRCVAAQSLLSKEVDYDGASEGRILFQNNTGAVWYRNIRIKEIATAPR